MTKLKKDDTAMSRKLKELNKKIKETFSVVKEEKKNEKITKKVATKKKSTVKTKKEVNNNEIITDKTYIIPLGGIEEIGKNMTVIQYRDEMD